MVYGNLEIRIKVHEALKEIKNNAAVKFDEELVKIFLRSVAAYPTGSLVKLNNGSNAIVLRQNAESSTKPIVRLVEKGNAGEWIRKETYNLLQESSLFIIDTIE